MAVMRDAAGYSSDTAIDLVSEDETEVEVEVQVPVAAVPTRVENIPQPARVYRTRAVTRAQAASGNTDSQTLSTTQIETSLIPSQDSRVTQANASRSSAAGPVLQSSTSIPTLSRAGHARKTSNGKNGKAAISAKSLKQLTMKESMSMRKPTSSSFTEQVVADDATHLRTGHTQNVAIQKPDLEYSPTSTSHRNTHKGIGTPQPVPVAQPVLSEQVNHNRNHNHNHQPFLLEQVNRNHQSFPLAHRSHSSARLLHGESEANPPVSVPQPLFPGQEAYARRADNATRTVQTPGFDLSGFPHGNRMRHDGEATSSALSSQYLAILRDGLPRYEQMHMRPALEVSINMPSAYLPVQRSDNNWVPRNDLPYGTVVSPTIQHTNDFVVPTIEPRYSVDRLLAISSGQNPTRDGADALIERRTTVQQNQPAPQPSIGLSEVQQRRLMREAKNNPVLDLVLRRHVKNNPAPVVKHRRHAKKNSEQDVVIMQGGHKNLSWWKQKAFERLRLGPEMARISAEVTLFNKWSIRTVVPNRYFRPSHKNSRQGRSNFPGSVEILDHSPITAITKAYEEHTADKRDVSRLVLWTDGSAGHGIQGARRGFAVTWRRSTATGWGRWEAAGFQAKGELSNSDGMECLAVMKALEIACDLVQKMPGQLKTVAIYTDSTSALHKVKTPRTPLAQQMVRKAVKLRSSGARISLHWCPGHSQVPGNELADRIAGLSSSHDYRNMPEVVDLSDDDDDAWEDV